MSWFAGQGNKSIVDKWSLVHFLCGFVIGANTRWWHLSVLSAMLLTTFLAISWELFEMWMEYHTNDPGPEGPLNRWVGDPIFVIGGALLGFVYISWGHLT
jgi:hypothetical protein